MAERIKKYLKDKLFKWKNKIFKRPSVKIDDKKIENEDEKINEENEEMIEPIEDKKIKRYLSKKLSREYSNTRPF